MADLLDLSGRTVIVTGAAAGLGRATAATVAAAGARVVLSDLPGAALEAAADELRAAGAEALARPARIGDRDEVRALVADTAADGGLHGVVACAGIFGTRPFATLSREEWDEVVNVNASGMFDLVQAAGTAMRPAAARWCCSPPSPAAAAAPTRPTTPPPRRP